MKKEKVISIICIAAMIISWSAYFVTSKWMVDYTGSAFLAGFILRSFAFITLTIYIIIKKEFFQVFKMGKTALILLVIGVLGYLLDTFANIGFQHSDVSTGTILLKTDILMATFASAVIFKEKLHLTDHIGTLIMLGGVICILNIDFSNISLNWYDLFFLASALTVTTNAFVIKYTQKEYKASSNMIAYYNNFVVLLLFLISSLILGDFKFFNTNKIGSSLFWILAVVGGIAQSLIYIFYYRNLKIYPVWQVKLFLLFVPIVSSIIGLIAFDEKITLLKIIGLILVLLGAVLILLRDKINKQSNNKIGGVNVRNK
ncbi:MAG: DMT family transporter [Clostridia bacterium]